MALRNKLAAAVLVFVAYMGVHIAVPNQALAACATQSYGSVTQTISVPASGTYRVWSRIKAPDSSSNSFMLHIDGGTCYTVGNGAITANTWTWVDYQNGSTSSKIDVTLTAGTHTIVMFGNEPNLQVDRVVLTSDTSCVPSGTGDNCANPPDTTAPIVTLTNPGTIASGATTVSLSAAATDGVGVTKVEFYVDGALKGSDTTSPYTYTWDIQSVTPGNHTLTAKAYDAAGNSSTSAAVVVNIPTPPPITYYFAYSTSQNRSSPVALDGKTVSGSIYPILLPTTNVTSVRFWIDDNTAAARSESSAPYDLIGGEIVSGEDRALPFDLTKLTNGPHKVTAVVTHSLGESTIVANFTVTGGIVVNPVDTTAPTTSVTSPTASQQLSGTVNLTANASDSVGVTKVEFYVDGALKGNDATSPYSLSIDTKTLSEGTHTVVTKAYDAAGNVGTSSSIAFKVSNGTYRDEDINQDGVVNLLDFSALAGKFGQSSSVGRADINKDGVVNILDFSRLASQFGK